eukprot:TRINITY_DN79074_c0_g1_i1.p1 TRINITY_DN79074_c0_g1~~TRINITY_DN79074_c0_g1_i1.p1  ORF type:complete len:302 (+),score=23.58 TRINITY_DN79074_c0_g1_i1:99-908(+)
MELFWCSWCHDERISAIWEVAWNQSVFSFAPTIPFSLLAMMNPFAQVLQLALGSMRKLDDPVSDLSNLAEGGSLLWVKEALKDAGKAGDVGNLDSETMGLHQRIERAEGVCQHSLTRCLWSMIYAWYLNTMVTVCAVKRFISGGQLLQLTLTLSIFSSWASCVQCGIEVGWQKLPQVYRFLGSLPDMIDDSLVLEESDKYHPVYSKRKLRLWIVICLLTILGSNLVVLMAMIKYLMSFRCPDSLWNLTSGCVNLNEVKIPSGAWSVHLQ